MDAPLTTILWFAVTLEILGDLPTADAAPPENVLFVAKLNPATRDEDLKIIFARYVHVFLLTGFLTLLEYVRYLQSVSKPLFSDLGTWYPATLFATIARGPLSSTPSLPSKKRSSARKRTLKCKTC